MDFLNTLFIFGVTVDICGAILLARGSIFSNTEIVQKSSESMTAMWGGGIEYYPGRIAKNIINDLSSKYGLASVLIGFAIQGLVYFVQTNKIDASFMFTEELSTKGKLIIALDIIVVGIFVYYLLWKIFRYFYVRNKLLKVIKSIKYGSGISGDSAEIRKARLLGTAANILGYKPGPKSEVQEDINAYVERIFKISIKELKD